MTIIADPYMQVEYFKYLKEHRTNLFMKLCVKCFAKISRHSIFPRIRLLALKCTGVKVGSDCFIGINCLIDDTVPELVRIGNGVTISFGVSIIAHKETRQRGQAVVAPVEICDGAFIGAGSIILPGVTVGKNAIVAAGAIVSKDVPDDCLSVGYASKVVCK